MASVPTCCTIVPVAQGGRALNAHNASSILYARLNVPTAEFQTSVFAWKDGEEFSVKKVNGNVFNNAV